MMMISLLWQYIRLGHGGYLAFGLSCANFILLTYTFVIERLWSIEPIYFVLAFFAAYLPVSAFLGYLQITRQHKVETKALFENNPRQAAIFLLLIKMIENKATPDEVAEKIAYLEKIVKK